MDLMLLNVKAHPHVFFIGVDLGKHESYTAIVVLERFDEVPDFTDQLRGKGLRRRYIVRQAERVEGGTEYLRVIKRLQTIVERLSPRGTCVVVVDGTGVGVPVVEVMKAKGLGCSLQPITISGGNAPTARSVPREVLLTTMQLMVEQGELEIAAGCRDIEALRRELAHLTLDPAARGEEPDDMAMAMSLGCWMAKSPFFGR